MSKITRTGCIIATLLAGGASAWAEPTITAGWHPGNVVEAMGASIIFGLLGIVMVIVGFKLFDKVITRIDIEEEIKKGNVAAAILAAAAIIGVALIVAASIG